MVDDNPRFLPVIGRWSGGTGLHYLGPTAPAAPFGVCLSRFHLKFGLARVKAVLHNTESSARIILGYSARTGSYYSVGIGGYHRAYVIDEFKAGRGWKALAATGSEDQVRLNVSHEIHVSASATSVALFVDGVRVLEGELPGLAHEDQLGLFAWGTHPVEFEAFEVTDESPVGAAELQNASLIRVFIASPTDVEQERELVPQLLQSWNDRHSGEYGCVLQPVRWETNAVPELGDHPQALLNRQLVDSCQMVIGMFWTRLGTPTTRFESGSVEEIERSLQQGKPVLLYFSSAPCDPTRLDIAEFQRLVSFKQEMQSRGLYGTYDSLDDLRQKLPAAVHKHVLRLLQGTPASVSTPLVQHAAPTLPQQFAVSRPKAELTVRYRTLRRDTDETGYCFKHTYELIVTLRNAGTTNLNEWHLDVNMPEVLLDAKAASDARRTLRRTSVDAAKTLYPTDEEIFTVEYVVDDDVFERRQEVFQMPVRVQAYAEGSLLGEWDGKVEELNNF